MVFAALAFAFAPSAFAADTFVCTGANSARRIHQAFVRIASPDQVSASFNLNATDFEPREVYKDRDCTAMGTHFECEYRSMLWTYILKIEPKLLRAPKVSVTAWDPAGHEPKITMLCEAQD